MESWGTFIGSPFTSVGPDGLPRHPSVKENFLDPTSPLLDYAGEHAEDHVDTLRNPETRHEQEPVGVVHEGDVRAQAPETHAAWVTQAGPVGGAMVEEEAWPEREAKAWR